MGALAAVGQSLATGLNGATRVSNQNAARNSSPGGLWQSVGFRVLAQLDDADLGEISKYLFIPDELFPADLAIVFGMTAWQRPLERSLRLYRKGMVKKLLFSGGFNHRIRAIEALEMAKAAQDFGVPNSDIIVDAHSTNTAENVANAYCCIEESVGIMNIASVVIVAIHFHIRRAKMTLKQVFPSRIKIGTASYSSMFYCDRDWHVSEKGRYDVWAELQKINMYLGEDISHLLKACAKESR
jgi:uncharacterized SAM-binding protein YcdF (DUF218 family)